jgi:hypothetical protein
MSARLIGVLAVAAVALTGCSKTIKESDVEKKLGDNLSQQYGVKGVKVDCPGGQKAKKGHTFDCTVTVGNQKTTAQVRLLSDDGKFTYLVKPAGG